MAVPANIRTMPATRSSVILSPKIAVAPVIVTTLAIARWSGTINAARPR